MIPPDLPWLIWLIWARGRATLEEIETHWSLLDVLKANDALDIQDELDAMSEAAHMRALFGTAGK